MNFVRVFRRPTDGARLSSAEQWRTHREVATRLSERLVEVKVLLVVPEVDEGREEVGREEALEELAVALETEEEA